MKNSYNGVVNLYKESGISSNSAMQKVRSIFDKVKGGHTGTLDPDAEGVLPIVLGKSTKLSDFLMSDEKEYRAELKLGIITDTLDLSGNILKTDQTVLDQEYVINAIKSFEKEYEQTPPMYSAIKVNGQKLYDLARKGIEVERKKRKVNIKKIEIVEIVDEFTYIIDIVCSKGTYIRSLCADIGDKLDVGASMGKLIRLRTGEFKSCNSYTLSQLQQLKDNDKLSSVVISPDEILKDYKKIICNLDAKKYIENGNKLDKKFFDNSKLEKNEKYLVYFDENLIGLYNFTGNLLNPEIILFDFNQK